MGMSTHVVGIKPPDETWKRMKKVWGACEDAGVPVPEEVRSFFNDETPDEEGVVVQLDRHGAVTRWKGDMREGFEVNVENLPKDVKIIRFYNSW